eukprot:m51a1_g3443 putative ran spi1 binding protein (187) ;mRNA; f:660479-661561
MAEEPTTAPVNEAEEKREAEEAEAEAAVNFEPVIKLHEVEVNRTNEEDEEAIFKMRAKLFRFDAANKEWKERGLGDVRLMQHKESHKVRILMRREKILKICLNHIVSPMLKLQENAGSDRSWVWTAMDFAEVPATQETLAIRFGSPENAKAFKAAFEDAQKKNASLEKKDEKPAEKKEEEKKEEKH